MGVTGDRRAPSPPLAGCLFGVPPEHVRAWSHADCKDVARVSGRSDPSQVQAPRKEGRRWSSNVQSRRYSRSVVHGFLGMVRARGIVVGVGGLERGGDPFCHPGGGSILVSFTPWKASICPSRSGLGDVGTGRGPRRGTCCLAGLRKRTRPRTLARSRPVLKAARRGTWVRRGLPRTLSTLNVCES